MRRTCLALLTRPALAAAPARTRVPPFLVRRSINLEALAAITQPWTDKPSIPAKPGSTKPSGPLPTLKAKWRHPQLRALHSFFAAFPDFDYKPTAPFPDEFARLHRSRAWPSFTHARRHWQRDRAYRAFYAAVSQVFAANVGFAARDSQAWERLCRYVGVPQEEMPKAWEARRELVLASGLNLVDLVVKIQLGDMAPVRRLGTQEEIEELLDVAERFFPKNNGMLNFLLEGTRYRWQMEKDRAEEQRKKAWDPDGESREHQPIQLGTLVIE